MLFRNFVIFVHFSTTYINIILLIMTPKIPGRLFRLLSDGLMHQSVRPAEIPLRLVRTHLQGIKDNRLTCSFGSLLSFAIFVSKLCRNSLETVRKHFENCLPTVYTLLAKRLHTVPK